MVNLFGGYWWIYAIIAVIVAVVTGRLLRQPSNIIDRKFFIADSAAVLLVFALSYIGGVIMNDYIGPRLLDNVLVGQPIDFTNPERPPVVDLIALLFRIGSPYSAIASGLLGGVTTVFFFAGIDDEEWWKTPLYGTLLALVLIVSVSTLYSLLMVLLYFAAVLVLSIIALLCAIWFFLTLKRNKEKRVKYLTYAAVYLFIFLVSLVAIYFALFIAVAIGLAFIARFHIKNRNAKEAENARIEYLKENSKLYQFATGDVDKLNLQELKLLMFLRKIENLEIGDEDEENDETRLLAILRKVENACRAEAVDEQKENEDIEKIDLE